jgi:heme-degrading monooxygenase HmoA
MIIERAQIDVEPGREEAFEAALAQAKDVAAEAPGFRSIAVWRGVEVPSRYMLLIEWDRVEDHTEGFRGSERFTQWRALIGPFFATTPEVEHYDPVAFA